MEGCGEQARVGEGCGAIASVGGYSPKALLEGALGIISQNGSLFSVGVGEGIVTGWVGEVKVELVVIKLKKIYTLTLYFSVYLVFIVLLTEIIVFHPDSIVNGVI